MMNDLTRKMGLSILGFSAIMFVLFSIPSKIGEARNERNFNKLKNIYEKIDSVEQIRKNLPLNLEGDEIEDFNLKYNKLKKQADSIKILLPKNYFSKEQEEIYKSYF